MALAVGTTGVGPVFQLQPAAYTDPVWLDTERANLFDRSWTLVADAAQLRQVGDRIGVVVGRHPIVIVHTGNGLAAFHNICRHRGMVLSPRDVATVGAPTLRCPYHGWEWALDGQLVRIPQRRAQFPDIDVDTLALHPASVEVWEGMVFAHPDPDAAPLRDALGAVPEHIGSFRPSALVEVGHARIEAAINWKLFVENHIDVYHLWYLHHRSLSAFDHAQFEHRVVGANWVSYEPARDGDDLTQFAVGTVQIRHLDNRDRVGLGAHMVFPNLLMAAAAEFFATYAVYPIAPDRSMIDLRVRAEPDADGAALLASARSFIDEDIRACEQVQRAIASRRFAVGPLARAHEDPIARFHDHVLAALADTPRSATKEPSDR